MKKTAIFSILLVALYSCGTASNTAHDHANEGEHTEATHEEHNHEGEEAHSHEAKAASAKDEHDHKVPGIIELPADQAKKLGVTLENVKVAPFSRGITTGGVIEPAQGDASIISATTSGRVVFGNRSITPGIAVSKGQALITIVSDDFTDDNLAERYAEARAAMEKSAADLKRAESLVGDKIVTQKELDALKLNYRQAELRFSSIAKGFSGGGKSITSPLSGYITDLNVSEGDYVSAGTPLMQVSQNKRLVLRVNMSQRDNATLGGTASSAHFTTPYNDKTYDIKALGGKKLAEAKSVARDSYYIPVRFEFDNKEGIIPGTYVEVYVMGSDNSDAISVPRKALIEQQGTYSVFVSKCSDTYERREVKIGSDNGARVQILSGLQPGDKVVSDGAIYVKLASMSNAAPEAHNHSH